MLENVIFMIFKNTSEINRLMITEQLKELKIMENFFVSPKFS
jgi:hypothetical protein